jgi:hypothetical protein
MAWCGVSHYNQYSCIDIGPTTHDERRFEEGEITKFGRAVGARSGRKPETGITY